MRWAESGGPPVTKPTRRGFGSTVIGRLVEAQLEAKVELSFAPEGLIWQMRCALAGLTTGTGPEANLQHMMEPPAADPQPSRPPARCNSVGRDGLRE